ncbi:hypothetical protein EV215_0124 [Hypnocyclicus thermotrophus]|uniref:Lipoprotein n=1 Tax=Hypnocyclicus thermotrophus TaxID=1627895 RepID=A0AA46I698_9FUSO|nr:hypothetical protein [Hypnocyclicus thermotrophus]TDT72324.1 hypothetical protein EV215_0124 [Hypnocyclicus thermotrophus]
MKFLKFFVLIFSFIIISCSKQSGILSTTNSTIASGYNSYTSAEITNIYNYINSNKIEITSIPNLTTIESNYLKNNITLLLTTISNEILTGTVSESRISEIKTATKDAISYFGIKTYDELSYIYQNIGIALTRSSSLGLTTEENTTLTSIQSYINTAMTSIKQNKDVNPYYSEIGLLLLVYREGNYSLLQNNSLLEKVGINLDQIDQTNDIALKLETLQAELDEFSDFDKNDLSIADALRKSLNTLKSYYISYTLGDETTIESQEALFRQAETAYLPYTTSMEATINSTITALKALSDDDISGYENIYNEIMAVLNDYEQKKAYYNAKNFKKIISETINIATTYRYIQSKALIISILTEN